MSIFSELRQVWSFAKKHNIKQNGKDGNTDGESFIFLLLVSEVSVATRVPTPPGSGVLRLELTTKTFFDFKIDTVYI